MAKQKKLSKKQRDRAAAAGKFCALCRLKNPLRHSHVISEFLYDPLYDDSHTFWSFTTKAGHQPIAAQKGIREYLLCDECESRINVYEKYARELFRSADDIGLRYEFDGPTTIVSGIDYKRFKLFQLSILWRASVAKHPYFRHVELGPLEETIRKMILENDPGPAPLFSCLMWTIRDGNDLVPVMLPPNPVKLLDRHHYEFTIAGYRFLFAASQQANSDDWNQMILSEAGRLVIGYVSYDHLKLELFPLMRQLDAMGRLPATSN